MVDFVRQFESYVAAGKLLLMQRVRFATEAYSVWGQAWYADAALEAEKEAEKNRPAQVSTPTADKHEWMRK